MNQNDVLITLRSTKPTTGMVHSGSYPTYIEALHEPTGLSVTVGTEQTQMANMRKAMELLAEQVDQYGEYCYEHGEEMQDHDCHEDGMCCAAMQAHSTLKCGVHRDPATCPDVLVIFTEQNGPAMPVCDGGSSYVTIKFCPWCGTDLS